MAQDNWIINFWRDFPTAHNAKIAFLVLHENGDEIPPELMEAIVEQLKKDVEYDTATMKDHEGRALSLYQAVENRPKVTTKTAIFKQFADKWKRRSRNMARSLLRANRFITVTNRTFKR